MKVKSPKHFLILACIALAACGQGTSSSTTSSSSSSSSTKSLGTCLASKDYHEYQLTADASLKATFDDITIAHLETGGTSPDDSRDSATAGLDTIAYTVTDGPRSITFTLDAGSVSTAVLKNSDGVAVLTLNKGDAATAVTLASGNYSLELTSDNSATSAIGITPSSCATSTSSAQTSVSKSVRKALLVSTPSVYITEIPNMTTIIPQATNVAVLIGVAGQGPLNTPTLVTSTNDYAATFGSISLSNSFSMAVWQFFENGGQTAYIINASSDSVADLLTAVVKLSEISSYNILVIPDLIALSQTDALTVIQSALSAAYDRNAIMIVDYPASVNTISAATIFANAIVQNSATASANATLYFPAVAAAAPLDQRALLIGNGSSVAGRYAATDLADGVWGSPAGIENGALQNVMSLPVSLTLSTIAYLSSEKVNGIWDVSGYGFAVWGINVLSPDADLKYINARRTFLSIKQSITQGLQPFIFESNTAATWEDVVLSLNNYLTTLWEQGALFGATASEAFSVECGLGTTMTADDILNGYMIVTVNVALVRPSEFVTLQFTQSMQGS